MEPITNIGQVLQHVRKTFKNPKALNYYDESGWHHLSTDEFLTKSKYLTLGLVKLGIKKGDNVGMLLASSPEWTMVNIAIILAGGISVPLFANVSDEYFLYQVKETEMQYLFVSGEDQFRKVAKHHPLIKNVIAIRQKMGGISSVTYDELIAMGYELDLKQPDLYAQLENSYHQEDLANIIYTSGSTGIPKGVKISHGNATAMINQEPFALIGDQDRYLSCLPLAHIFGYAMNFVMIGSGVPIYYYNDLTTLGVAAKDLHPTVISVVPRLLEKIYAKMLGKVQSEPFIKRTIAQLAFDLAYTHYDTIINHLVHPVVDKLVYSTLREALGGSLRIVISGGAALNPRLCHFFIEIGIPIYEGWGLTEGTPITVNTPGNRKIGTVGPTLKGNEMKLSPEGEVLARGVVVTSGYYKNPELTAEALDSEGWLHTGDKGVIDAEGYLTIVGRIKELYKSSNGKYIAPVPIEQAICQAPLIDMAMVIADKRKFPSVVLFPNHEILDKLKAEQKATDMTDEQFLNSFFIKSEMEKLLQKVNNRVNKWEQIQAYTFVLNPLTIEEGDLTPSMKIRRDIVAEKYQHIIDAMYLEEDV